MNSGPVSIEIDTDGNVTTLTKPEEIANAYNSHYSTVADKILNQRKYQGNKSFHHYLKDPNTKTFMIKPTTTQEIEDTISKVVNAVNNKELRTA